MTTKELIEVIKQRTHNPMTVLYKYALFYVLNEMQVPVYRMEKLTGFTRATVYYGLQQMKGLLSIDDHWAKEALQEVRLHRVSVPMSVLKMDGGYSRPDGYKLMIDQLKYE